MKNTFLTTISTRLRKKNKMYGNNFFGFFLISAQNRHKKEPKQTFFFLGLNFNLEVDEFKHKKTRPTPLSRVQDENN